MLLLTRRVSPAPIWQDELILPFELRQKGRLRTRAASGEEVGLFLDRGQPIRHEEFLQAEDGRIVRVIAAPEPLLHVTCASPLALCRAAYHLGNRHVPLQVGDGFLRLLDDYVLADMLGQLGATVSKIEAPFEPEAGAYGGGHHHSHGNAEFVRKPRIHDFKGQPA